MKYRQKRKTKTSGACVRIARWLLPGTPLCFLFVFFVSAAHCHETTPTLLWEGQTWRLLDDGGLFAISTMDQGDATTTSSLSSDAPLPDPNVPLNEILDRRSPEAPIPCRLVDYIDATTTDSHNFRDDGKSRVMKLSSGWFRVTGAPKGFDLNWFSFDINTADRAGRPHLLAFELSNDRERYTTLNLTTPEDQPWSQPYLGARDIKVDGIALSQEPIWCGPDVGLNVYTGRELPLDGKSFRKSFLFYPKTKTMTLTVSSSGWDLSPTEATGGALSRIWVFEVLESPGDHLPRIQYPTEGPRRHFGVYTTHPWYFLAHYGAPPHTVEQRRASLENLCDALAFSGINLIEFNAINGSDRASRAWYPGSHYSREGAEAPDLLSEAPPVAASRNIDLIPVVTSITAPGDVIKGEINTHGFSEMSFQHPADPARDPRAFEDRAPDPLRPETQDWLILHLMEIAEKSRLHENVIGVGFRVNGKIGTCYISGEDKSGPELTIISAEETGYSKWDLEQFRDETGRAVPEDSLEAFRWLKADPERWDAWLDFRCRRTRDFWLRARDAIQAVRPDWNLYVLTDLPSEVQATNILWPGRNSPDAEKITLDLLRAHGYDPRMFTTEKGIIIQRVAMIDMERFFSKWGPPFGTNPERYREFHEQTFLPDLYRTTSGSAVELYHTYWEEPFHPQGEFGPNALGFGLRTATALAAGQAGYRSLAVAVGSGSFDTVVMNGWIRPTLGRESGSRPYGQALLALPPGEGRPLAIDGATTGVTAARYGDRICVVNGTDQPAHVTVRLFLPLARDTTLVDAVTGAVMIAPRAAVRDRFIIHLKAWDMRTLIPGKD